jgi:hypothetical protein
MRATEASRNTPVLPTADHLLYALIFQIAGSAMHGFHVISSETFIVFGRFATNIDMDGTQDSLADCHDTP